MTAFARVATVLADAVASALASAEGEVAGYIPDLSGVDPERTSAAIVLPDGSTHIAGSATSHRFSLQGAAKLILLGGALDEFGPERVFALVGTEPTPRSGGRENPMTHAGAMALCGMIEGPAADRIAWIERWAARCCGKAVKVNETVQAAERKAGDRNRALADSLCSAGVLTGSIDDTLETYFALCSLEATVVETAHLGCVLAMRGVAPNGTRIIADATVLRVVSLMSSCGMQDESGAHLMATGLPAKSGLSGVIASVAVGRAGIGVCSPRLDGSGVSVRGHIILEHVSRELGWHFARAGGVA
jgi:glutaminase